jgi:hypothetical protein
MIVGTLSVGDFHVTSPAVLTLIGGRRSRAPTLADDSRKVALCGHRRSLESLRRRLANSPKVLRNWVGPSVCAGGEHGSDVSAAKGKG